MKQEFRQIKNKGLSGNYTLEGELVAARENHDSKRERQVKRMILAHRDALENRDKKLAQFQDLYEFFNPYQGGDPSARTSTEDADFVTPITQDLLRPSTSNPRSHAKAKLVARYHLENGSLEHTDDVAFGEDEGDSEDDEGGDDEWDAREEDEGKDAGRLKGLSHPSDF
ncbi:hypothetical protein D1P53_001760 [Cryptococcus gattii VGV]|nr:hypothetical protein D1P53_001760 [Cryptococcus gattii VGV]